MIGTFRINFIVATVAFLLTFLLSMGNNLFLTTLIHSFYSFVILFILTFGFRWILGTIGGTQLYYSDELRDEPNIDDSLGTQVNMATPDEDEITRLLLKQNMDNPGNSEGNADNLFSPLNPPKLAAKNNLEPEQLAGALRRLSED
jgi:energy-coupling factor transporter transmembrane protein EcfT